MNLRKVGSVVLGVNDIRKESSGNNEEDIPDETIHTYDFQCSCNKCTENNQIAQETGKIIRYS